MYYFIGVAVWVMFGLWNILNEEYMNQTRWRLIYNDGSDLSFKLLLFLTGPIGTSVSYLTYETLKIALPLPKNYKYDAFSKSWKYECEFSGAISIEHKNFIKQAFFESTHSLNKEKISKINNYLGQL